MNYALAASPSFSNSPELFVLCTEMAVELIGIPGGVLGRQHGFESDTGQLLPGEEA